MPDLIFMSPERRPLRNPEILRHVVPQNDKIALYCHAELVEASRFSVLSAYAKVSQKREDMQGNSI